MAQEGNFTFPLFFLFFKYGILKLNMPIFFRASNIFKNKKTASLLAGLVFFSILAPIHFVNADLISDLAGTVAEPIINILSSLVFILPQFFMIIAVAITSALTAVVGSILMWIADISLTIPIIDANIVKNVGWPFTLGLVNMGYLLILAWIGLSTILRLKEYEAQKMIPKLILNALLVNFSLVLVGFVVDIGNLLTHFFLKATQDMGGLELSGAIENSKKYIIEAAKNLINPVTLLKAQFTLDDILGTLVYGIALILFNIFATFIIGAVAFVFFIRVIYFWILAILAPIAFFSKIATQTAEGKSFFPGILGWDEWWSTLLKWVFIGIPLGFFLFLSTWMMSAGNNDTAPFKNSMGCYSNANPPSPTNLCSNPSFTAGSTCNCCGDLVCQKSVLEYQENPTNCPGDCTATNPTSIVDAIKNSIVNLVSKLMQPFVALMLLFMGLMIAIQSAPNVAKGALEYAQKVPNFYRTMPKKIAGRRIDSAVSKVSGWGAKGISGTSDLVRKKTEWLDKVPVIGGTLKTMARQVPEMADVTLGSKAQEIAAKKRKIDIEARFKEEGATTMEDKVNVIKKLTMDRDKLQAYNYMAEKGWLGKLPNDMQAKARELSIKDLGDPYFGDEAKNIMNTYAGEHLTKELKVKMTAKDKRDSMERKIGARAIMEKSKEATEAEMQRYMIANPGTERDQAIINIEASKKITEKEISAKIATDPTRKMTRDQAIIDIGASRGVTLTDKDNDEAAKLVYFDEGKTSDITKYAKSTKTSPAYIKYLRDSDPANLRETLKSVDEETRREIIDKTFNDVLKGKEDEKDKQEAVKKFFAKRKGLLNWVKKNPTAQNMEISLLEYLTDIEGNATDDLKAFTKNMEVGEIIKREAVEELRGRHGFRAKDYLDHIKEIKKYEKQISTAKKTDPSSVKLSEEMRKEEKTWDDAKNKLDKDLVDVERELNARRSETDVKDELNNTRSESLLNKQILTTRNSGGPQNGIDKLENELQKINDLKTELKNIEKLKEEKIKINNERNKAEKTFKKTENLFNADIKAQAVRIANNWIDTEKKSLQDIEVGITGATGRTAIQEEKKNIEEISQIFRAPKEKKEKK